MSELRIDPARRSLDAEEFRTRVERARHAAEAAGYAGLVVYGTEGYPHLTRYFANHWPSFEPALVLIPVTGDPLVVVGVETPSLAASTSPFDVATAAECAFWAAPDYVDIQAGDLGRLVAERFGSEVRQPVALAPTHIVPARIRESLERSLPRSSVTSGDRLVEDLRRVKSGAEVELLRAASSVAEDVFGDLLARIALGMTEMEVTDLANAECAARGSEAPAYFGWCAFGPNTVNPIYRSGETRLAPDDLVQLNIGPRVGGYSGSVARPIALGSVSSGLARMIDDAFELAARTVEALRPGRAASDVANEVMGEMRRRGYPGLYGPAHTTGMEECELPWVQPSADFELVPNMTFNVDLWLDRDGRGVRVEDGVVLTTRGAEVLSPRFHDLVTLT